MARLLVVIGIGAAVLLAVMLPGAASEEARRYTVELDNAFGMVEGGDVRIAGSNAGTVAGIRLDQRSKKALIDIDLTDRSFGPLRADAFCETRPQSPLGEHFLDCRPGTSSRLLPERGRLRVEQTASTIPPDLIANIMRRPYRERFRLILNELGAGLAGRPQDLNAAIRRAVPALRQTRSLLRILARHDRVIRDLTVNADRVIGELARNRRNVGRFVVEAGEAAATSAERADDLATNWRKLPRFLQELTPTMAALGETATEQRPVLQDLSAAAPDLREFLDRSADLAEVTRPALRELGETADIGTPVARALRPHVAQLREYGRPLVDLAPNLRIVLEDFSDPARAVEHDPRAAPQTGKPGQRGYSGAQALLQYIFNQTLVNNAFDELGYTVRSGVFTDRCSAYADAEEYKQNPSKHDCPSWLGPNQPGVTTPDPSAEPEAAAAAVRAERRALARRLARERRLPPARRSEPRRGDPSGPGGPLPPALRELLERLPAAPELPERDLTPLLDYLLGQ